MSLNRRQAVLGSGLWAGALLAPWALPAWAGLSEGDAVSGIRAALERGANSAIANLGRKDGFQGNPAVRIDLPGQLKDGVQLLKMMGQGQQVDDLLVAMNRAAEAAVPAAKPLLSSAIRSMSVEDGKRILQGGDDAITQYFAGKTREPLARQFLPIVTQATQKVALSDKYNAVAGKAAGLGLIKSEDADLPHYVTGRALDGLFHMIADEERRIRQDPVGTGSALLKQVFGV
ncbi:DUF4197 domain-containing protein [Paucibacter sp. hw1]|uniref:DUF4197 domain-containing protein n=2 Tax=Roseateles koreensis TaxID=2987526 RepID=A0ABT5KPS6_9BURK|nr:DUF4197 domain-containing protein [Roseateles koreensis]MDC8784922.1 DUF4197 domain-containing protein [Roseateles koreensis]